MASISKPKHSKHWYAVFRVPVKLDPATGKVLEWKQVRKSTGQTDRGKAEKAAVSMEETLRRQAGAGDEKSARLLGILQKATDFAVQGRLSEPLARQLIAELYEEVSGSSMTFYTVESWMAEWVRRKEKKVKPATLYLYKQAAKEFLNWLGSRRNDRLECIARDDVARFIEHVHESGRTGKTANQFKKSIFNAFKTAAQSGLILQNPADGVEDLPQDDSVPREAFTLDQIRMLCSVANPEWRAAILLGAYAGLRLRDAANLRWKAVDLLGEKLVFEPMKQRRSSKTKKVVSVKIHKALRDALEPLPSADDPEAPVFPTLAKKPTGGNGGLSSSFSAIMAKAGIDPKPLRKSSEGAPRDVTARSFHSLRHFFNTAMAESGVPQELRRQLVGHTSDDVNDIYTHWKAEHLDRAVDSLPGL